MSDEETITVAEISDGPGGGTGTPGASVDLPVVEILTGRGFITGKSGSGKSNTASVVIENLLSNNFPVLIVDTDGEYYGLKEAFEILHVGADEECDIQVSPEHSEKIASLALEQNVPIILDVSGYLDESDAEEMLLQTARSLFAKEKKLKKPFLMLVEECHEYIPEKGGMGEAGKMLIKIGKRGRKHGLGIVGISQRPADVKKDYITQCDWLCWHRLTWNNDTKVVGRILGKEYADAIEDMDNGESFLITDWSESIRRVQFHRKETFDAGATPGLDDFERPELKSVSGDLVDELSDISDEKARRESELADLRQELDRKRAKIDQLERELEDAKDLKRMADKFSQALLGRAEAPYRQESRSAQSDQRELREYEREEAGERERTDATDDALEHASGAMEGGSPGHSDGDSDDGRAGDADAQVSRPFAPQYNANWEGEARGPTGNTDGTDSAWTDDDWVDADVVENESENGGQSDDATEGSVGGDRGDGWFAEGARTRDEGSTDEGGAEAGTDVGSADAFDPEDALDFAAEHVELGTREAIVEKLSGRVESLPAMSKRMLGHYREVGVAEPVDAHIAAGGDSDRTLVYSRNRPLRRAGFVRHAGRGQYTYVLPELIREAYADRLDDEELAEMTAAVEAAFLDDTADVDGPGETEGEGADVEGETVAERASGDAANGPTL
ncbi:helicase HerA domain-containing protein [Halobium salinum]|uniref:Helicase HerA domain-containing protein n=1 Tax=Halobium salinum TaxID=1364940 RepID=A0ABD5P6F3_9EURY|nr:DUF87 domain-containing protein [Halobium salinum]